MPAQAQRLGADMLEVIRTPETPLVLRRHARGREPIGPFPAVALAEDRAHALEFVVNRTGLGRPRVGPLLVGIVNDENVAVRFLVLLNDVTLARVGAIAARIDGHHIDAWFAFDDPLRELPARAAGGGDAEAMTFVEPKVLRTPGRSHQGAAPPRRAAAGVPGRLRTGSCRTNPGHRRQIARARPPHRAPVSSPCALRADSTTDPIRAARRVRGRRFGGRLSTPATRRKRCIDARRGWRAR